jgi:ribonuclease M5
MIKEVIVVEGKSDVAAVRRAVDADCIVTGGYSLLKQSLEAIAAASRRRGIIILTDPDSPGERIRSFLSKRFPDAKHAFVAKADALANGDVGVEQASAETIRAALAAAKAASAERRFEFSFGDLLNNGLSGTTDSGNARSKLGMILGLGHCNSKQFLQRLNNYGISRAEFEAALQTGITDNLVK